MVTSYVKGRLYKLNIADLLPDPNQARTFMDPVALAELTASIVKMGVMVPIQFRQDDLAALIIVSGHRRVAASRKAGLTDIYGTYTDGDTRLQGFVENLQRENLTPIDEAEQMAALMKEYVFSQYQLADAIGKSQPVISKTLTLNNLPEDIRDACRTNPNIQKAVLLDVAKGKTEEAMRRKFQSYMDKAAKEGQPAGTKIKMSKERTLINQMDVMGGKLDGLPLSEWSEDDRHDFLNAMDGVRSKMDALLDGLNPQNPQPTENEPGQPSRNLA